MLDIRGKHPGMPDEELIRRFRKDNDLDLLGELYSRYIHLVYGVSLKYLEEREEARDSVMQIFEKLITELPKHQVTHFKSWLYTLTRNHCLMAIRSRKSRQKLQEGWEKDVLFMESGGEVHPIDRNDGSLDQALERCIAQLKEEQKRCIELFYYQDQCYQEIAKKMGTDVKKVKSWLQNGKRNLKICLEKDHEREEGT